MAPDAGLAGTNLEEQLPAAPGHTARRIATISFYRDPPVVQLPASAHTGQPIELYVTTYGGGCIGEDTTVVAVNDLRTDVVPYQKIYTPRGNEGCTLELRITRRAVRLVFSKPGIAIVQVTGRAAPGDSLVQVKRALLVD